jgi:lipid-A-disaccharide synthase
MGDLLLLTGDSSADRYAANLVTYLENQGFSGTVYAAAGHRTEQAGAVLVENLVDRSVVGFSEITGSLPYFYDLYRDLDEVLSTGQFDAVLFMDFPGFNLAFTWLSRARDLDIPLFYYITPQVWAWWQWRVNLLRDWYDECFVIFPFEEELLREEGVSARFVGHPMLEDWASESDYDAAETLEVSPGKRIVSFFPGSRDQEVQQHLDVMVETAQRVDEADEQFHPVFSAAPTVDQSYFRDVFEDHGCEFPVWGADSRSLLEDSTVAMLASGTVTMEATFCETPMVVGYRTSWITWYIGRYLSGMDEVAMPNLIHEESFVPEYLQGDFTVDNLSEALIDLLCDQVRRREQSETLGAIKQRFQRRNPSEEVGDALLRALT